MLLLLFNLASCSKVEKLVVAQLLTYFPVLCETQSCLRRLPHAPLSCVITNVDGREDPHFLIRIQDEGKLSVTYFGLLIAGKTTPRDGSCLDRRVGLKLAVDKYFFI